MTKSKPVGKMAKDAGLSKSSANATLNAIIDGIMKELKKKEGKVTLIGSGHFRKFAERPQGRNPSTGEAMKIKESNAVKFKAGKKLKEAV